MVMFSDQPFTRAATNVSNEPALTDAARRTNGDFRKQHKLCGRLDADDRHPIQPHREKP
jgi:hypothetical protein